MSRQVHPHFVMVCVQGCCAGCQGCYGMSIGCHQEPCRCGLPCACRWPDEDTDPRWRDGCQRHDSSHDQRRHYEPPDGYDDAPFLDDTDIELPPCVECGSTGACAYDDQGRPLIHTTPVDNEDQP